MKHLLLATAVVIGSSALLSGCTQSAWVTADPERIALVLTGNFAEAVVHEDQALALYDPVEHRPLATRFVQDPRVGALCWRSLALWALGYPEAALAGTEQALSEARTAPCSECSPWC